MARFLIGTIPVVGHVSPGIAIARALIERGHEVWWYTGSAFQSTVEATGAHFVPITNGVDYSYPENVPQAWTDQRNTLQGAAQLKFDLKHFFIDAALGQVKDFAAILSEFPADVLVTDSFFLGASWICEQGGPLWAEFGVSALGFSSQDTAPFGLGLKPNASRLGRLRNRFLNGLLQQVLFRDVTAHMNKLRVKFGLPASSKPFFDNLSPFLYLAGTVPSFEYPRQDLPPQVHFIGPLLSLPSTEFVPPSWWSDLQGDKPVVHVTQGTVATEASNLIVPTLQALADEAVLVVATTGGQAIEGLNLQSIPANVRLEQFIPHAHLLPHVDVMVTNGGFNGVQMALAQGVPLVAAGQTEDKPEICARIEWTGVGINLKTKTPTPDQIKHAVRKVLTDANYKNKAKDLQLEISQYKTSELAATLLEQLALTQQPILRS
ncbi:MAG TPA: nucleotide disphospho-sugar-binding domain-containing protein [Coleofasciculaceae cyanobacterium]